MMRTRFVIGLLLFVTGVMGQSYTYYHIGDTSNTDVQAMYGVCLMGGGTENDDACRWFLKRARGGDVLVLRTSGNDGYQEYFYNELGVPVHSVETIVMHSRRAAQASFVLEKIAKAEAIWFAGGDQATYLDYWKGTEVEKTLRNKIQKEEIVLGGTSAGMAILSGCIFSAENGTIRSQEALDNPFDARITLDSSKFLGIKALDRVITETHFDNPDRKGRLTAFLSRTPGYFGIACEESTAVCIDETGWATVFGSYPEFEDQAYFIRRNCRVVDNEPEVLEEGKALTWDHNGSALQVAGIKGTPTGRRFHLPTWSTMDEVEWENWSVQDGQLEVKATMEVNCFPFLGVPVTGQSSVDWTIVNYVDWSSTGVLDYQCGSKSYDGHQGTDFTIRSFPQMDTGVYILAAADGEVTFVQDGLYDRETGGDVSKGLGNYIAMRHPNRYYSYYGHLKNNAMRVSVGDWVQQGDTIAEMGSSGNSTDPHLHFELWYDSLYVVDPFRGGCGNANSLWLEEPQYETALNVWENGMHNIVPTLDDLRERIVTVPCCPFLFPTNSSKPITFWAHLYGLKAGSTLTIDWYNPSDILWFSFDVELERDWWYYYYWSFIDNKNLAEGQWKVTLSLDGKIISEQDFKVDVMTSTGMETSACQVLYEINGIRDLKRLESPFVILDISGKYVDAKSVVKNQWYYVRLTDKSGCGRWMFVQ